MNHSDEFTRGLGFNIVWSLFSGSISLAGVVAYGLVVYIVLKYKRTTFDNSFYTLALSLAVPDCLTGCQEVLFSIPYYFLPKGTLPLVYENLLGYLRHICWYILSSHMLIISTNRLIAVTTPVVYLDLFRRQRVAVIIALSYTYGLCMTAAMHACHCRMRFEMHGWLFDCRFNGTCAADFIQITMVMSMSDVSLVVTTYVIIFIILAYRGCKISPAISESDLNQRRERSLVIQFGMICGVLVMYECSFYGVPALATAGYLSFDGATVIITTFAILNSAVNPFLYMTFGSDIKKRLRLHFRLRTHSPIVRKRSMSASSRCAKRSNNGRYLAVRKDITYIIMHNIIGYR